MKHISLRMSMVIFRRVRLKEEQDMKFQPRPQGFPGRPTMLSLLPNFGKHVACTLWVDVQVIIIV